MLKIRFKNNLFYTRLVSTRSMFCYFNMSLFTLIICRYKILLVFYLFIFLFNSHIESLITINVQSCKKYI